jgi:cation transport regulator ChaC
MALVFQYGSNLDSARLNGPTRLQGDARVLSKAVTQDDFEFVFDIWSTSEGGRAAADIISGRGQKIWGVIYDIPDYLIKRSTAQARQRKALDAIEGEGTNYKRIPIGLNWPDGRSVAEPVITYIGNARQPAIKTNQQYVNHILRGVKEHGLPADYVSYVKQRIKSNNPELDTEIS